MATTKSSTSHRGTTQRGPRGRRPITIVFAGILGTTLSVAAPAWSQTGADQARARALFDEGRRLITAGQVAEACPKFAESQRLDPTAIGVLLNLGDCNERLGKTATAWAAFSEAVVVARRNNDTAGAEEGARRAKLLEPKLARVTIQVPPASRAPGLEVKWDGKPAGEGTWGTAVPVDPGEHTIEASAPGRKGWSGKVSVTAAGTTTAEVPLLVEAPANNSAAGPEAAPVPFWRPQRIAGTVIAGAGLVGFGVGAAFTAAMSSKYKDSLDHCQKNNVNLCEPTGVSLRKDSIAAGNTATAIVISSGVVLATGAVLFFTASLAKQPASGQARPRVAAVPLVAPGLGGVLFQGVW
jgi:hypothetical protein